MNLVGFGSYIFGGGFGEVGGGCSIGLFEEQVISYNWVQSRVRSIISLEYSVNILMYSRLL